MRAALNGPGIATGSVVAEKFVRHTPGTLEDATPSDRKVVGPPGFEPETNGLYGTPQKCHPGKRLISW